MARSADLNSRGGHSFQQVHIEGGRVQLGDNYRLEVKDPLERLPYAANATFNSYHRQHESLCLPGTRQEVLENIYSWAEGDECGVFWLNGWAGSGKSTIARTVSRRYHEQKRLGASFFFSRDDRDIRHAESFVTSLARQLADSVPGLRRHVGNAAEEHSYISTQCLQDQWQRLILQPLSKLENCCDGRPLVLIVLDALDECDDSSNVQNIIGLLSDSQSIRPIHLRFLVTSRPEIPIRLAFQRQAGLRSRGFVLQDVSRTIIDEDIMTYLRHQMEEIAAQSGLPDTWPGVDKISQLVQNAGSLFIWAVTACRFIAEGFQFAENRLDLVLNASARSTTMRESHPEKQLDRIYTMVLSNCVSSNLTNDEESEAYQLLSRILGAIIALYSPLPVEAFSDLLGIDSSRINRTLLSLHSIMDIPQDTTLPFRLHHPSFRDFLLNEARCLESRLRADEHQLHGAMSFRCIRMMASLKRNLLEVWPATYLLSVEREKIRKCIPPDLQYACTNWLKHLQDSGKQPKERGEVHRFLLDYSLQWIEAMCWMEKLDDAVAAMLWLESTVNAELCPNFYAFVHDLNLVLHRNKEGIESHPLQIYISAIVFAPTTSVVRRRFEDRVLPKWLKELPRVPRNWTHPFPAENSLGYCSGAYIVELSPDCKYVASASRRNAMQLWDASNGDWLRPLIGHSASINKIVFSPDAQYLFSASYDSTVIKWHIRTGRLTLRFTGHMGPVFNIVLSSDGGRIASASADGTIRVCDTSNGVQLSARRICRGAIPYPIELPIAFSRDAEKLAWAILDLIKVCDSQTGVLQKLFQNPSGAVDELQFSSDGDHLKSESGDEVDRVWNISTGQMAVDDGSISFDDTQESHGYYFFAAGDWIWGLGVPLVWLPQDFQQHGCVSWDDKIAVGHSYGHVTFWKIDYKNLKSG